MLRSILMEALDCQNRPLHSHKINDRCTMMMALPPPLSKLLLLGLVLQTMIQTINSFSAKPGKQRLALVTGGNKGIGKEIARLIGKEPNFTVLIACRTLELGQEAVRDLKSCNSNDDDKECNVILLPIPLDLTNPTSIKAAAEWVENEYNGVLDVLINNAAICFNSPTLYNKVDYTTFEDQADITIDTNYFGTLNVIQSFLPLLEKSDYPRIINIASAAGRLSILKSQKLVDKFTSDTLTIPQLTQLMQDFVKNVKDGTHTSNGWPNTCYGVSKVGIIALTKILARQYPQMKINSVDPGYCKTDQNDNMGTVDPYRGAYTPYLLAASSSLEDEEEENSGLHFYEERSIPWSYQL